MNIRISLSVVMLFILGLGLSDASVASETECDQIHWRPQILAGFSGINQACQGVVVRDGKKYVHFEVKFVKALEAGKVRVRMKMNDGTWIERMFFAPKDFQVLSASGKTTFNMHEFQSGDILDVYIPESRIIAAELGNDS